MPADVAGCARRHRCRLLIAVGCKQHESGAMRIAGDGETSNARNVLGTAVDRAAGLLDTVCIGVDIVDPDVTHPRRIDAGFARVLGDRHQSADHGRADREQRVAAIGHAGILCVPADYTSIECLGGFRIRGHHVVPDEFSGCRGHWRHFLSACAAAFPPVFHKDAPVGVVPTGHQEFISVFIGERQPPASRSSCSRMCATSAEALARALVGDDLDPKRLVNARTVAQMEVMLGRICDAQIVLINRELKKQIGRIRPAEDRSDSHRISGGADANHACKIHPRRHHVGGRRGAAGPLPGARHHQQTCGHRRVPLWRQFRSALAGAMERAFHSNCPGCLTKGVELPPSSLGRGSGRR